MVRALLACALALAAPPAAAFEATGEVLFSTGTSAAFDAERVVGPAVNLTRQEGGAWAGDILGQNVVLEVGADRIRGPNVEITIERRKGSTAVRGLFLGNRFTLEWDAKGFRARVGACSYDLERSRNGMSLVGSVGCVSPASALPRVERVGFRVSGQAAELSPPQPQFTLALVATLFG